MDKNLEYYMGLDYPVKYRKDPVGGFFIEIPDLPGCMSQGDTLEEAVRMIEDAKRAWLEVEIEDGRPIPEPQEIDAYSGKILVRMSKSLHKKLADQAKMENVSLNHHVVSLLSEGTGNKVKASEINSLEIKMDQIMKVVEQILKNNISGFQPWGLLPGTVTVGSQVSVYGTTGFLVGQDIMGRKGDVLNTSGPLDFSKNKKSLKKGSLLRTIGEKREEKVAV